MPISVSGGGTGWDNLAANYILAGNNTNPVQGIAPGAVNTALMSNGTAALPSFRALVANDLPVIPVAKGGTGRDNLATNYLLAGNGTSPVNGIVPAAAGTVLVSNGTAALPNFRALVANDLPVVPVPKGGTGCDNLAANYLLAGNGTSPVIGIAPEVTGTVLMSNGTTALPTFKQITSLEMTYTYGSPNANTRTVYSRLRDRVDLLDFGAVPSATTLVNAVTDVQAAGGGSLWLSNGYNNIALPANYDKVALRYDGPMMPVVMFDADLPFFSQTAIKFMDSEERVGQIRTTHSAHHIESHPIGSGKTGPLNADCALTVSLIKQNLNLALDPDNPDDDLVPSAQNGELDGLYIVVRNDSDRRKANPQTEDSADTTAFLADVATYGKGFNAGYEIGCTLLDRYGGPPHVNIDLQAAVINSRDLDANGLPTTSGYVINGNAGLINQGILVQRQGSSRFENVLVFKADGKVRLAMPVDSSEAVSLKLFDSTLGPDGKDGSKSLRVRLNTFSILDKAGTQELFTLDDSGNGTFRADLNAGNTTVASLSSLSTISAAGLITPSSTAGIKGTTAGDNANSGSIGEFIDNTGTTGSLTSGATVYITSIPLSPGDWDVSGTVQFFPSASTVMQLQYGGISTTSTAFGPLGTYFQYNNVSHVGDGCIFATPVTRINVTAGMTVYLVTQAVFSSGGSCTASGVIRARRMR